MKRLLLLSTSTVHGTGYLEHGAEALKARLQGVSTVCFIPFALKDHDAYAAKARAAFEGMGFGLVSLHEAADPVKAIEAAEAVFCGGGNTFRLLETLYRLGVLAPLRARALAGMPYTGASAGSNLACPTIRTTNDMPIVQPPSFEALGVGLDGWSWKELRYKNGRLRAEGKLAARLERLGATRLHATVAHDGGTSFAVVTLEG